MTLNTDIEFSTFIANRALSGVVNGLFYAGALTGVGWALVGLVALTAVVCIFPMVKNWRKMKRWQRVLSIAGAVGSMLSVVFLGVSFFSPSWRVSDIHLWTLAHQTAMAGTNFFSRVPWWLLMLAVAPSVLLQKMFVNIIPGNRWNYRGTDISNGKHYTIPLLRIKVPRIANMYVQLGISLLSIGAYFLILRKRR